MANLYSLKATPIMPISKSKDRYERLEDKRIVEICTECPYPKCKEKKSNKCKRFLEELAKINNC